MKENEQILTKAIEKAQQNGWYNDSWHRIVPTDAVRVTLYEGGCVVLHRNGSVDETHINEIIFNHDFAKALWKEDETSPVDAKESYWLNLNGRMKLWQYHLQQMVIADDPIEYLGEHAL